MSSELLLEQPSVPRATLAPAAMSLAMGQKPEASFRFELLPAAGGGGVEHAHSPSPPRSRAGLVLRGVP